MQDDILNAKEYSTFMIRMGTNTDGDGKDDFWIVRSSRYPKEYTGPHISYLPSPVGGTVLSANYQHVSVYLAITLSALILESAFIASKKRQFRIQ